jgi:hypothetical protein
MMKRVVAAIGLLLALCASANAENFVGIIDGLQENPIVVTPGSGLGTATYDAGTQMLSVDVNFSGLTGTTTNAHIHCCANALTGATSDTNAGIAIHFVPTGFPLGVTSGSYSNTFDLSLAASFDAGYLTASGGTAALARDRLLNAMRFGVANDPLPGNSSIAYFNIHTSFRPGGEIRGNIIPFVPEPSTGLLVAIGMAAVALRRRGHWWTHSIGEHACWRARRSFFYALDRAGGCCALRRRPEL